MLVRVRDQASSKSVYGDLITCSVSEGSQLITPVAQMCHETEVSVRRADLPIETT